MKELFRRALRQATGFVERLLRLVGFDWTAPVFSTLSRHQKTLAVNIPYRGSKGPRHLRGQSLMARDFDRQVAELQVRTAVLNACTALGIPVTEAVG